MLYKILGIFLTLIFLIILFGCVKFFQKKDKTYIEVKEKMNSYLTEKYKETFVISNIVPIYGLFSVSYYSSKVWPIDRPDVVFLCTLKRGTGELGDDYPHEDFAYRNRAEVVEAFEMHMSNNIALLQKLAFSVPYGREITLGDTLDKTFIKNPGEVSLRFHVFIEANSVDAQAITERIRVFIDEYVSKRGYYYLTLRIWFMPSTSIEKYKEDLEKGWEPYFPSDNMCSAKFELVKKVPQIDSIDLLDHIVVFQEVR